MTTFWVIVNLAVVVVIVIGFVLVTWWDEKANKKYDEKIKEETRAKMRREGWK